MQGRNIRYPGWQEENTREIQYLLRNSSSALAFILYLPGLWLSSDNPSCPCPQNIPVKNCRPVFPGAAAEIGKGSSYLFQYQPFINPQLAKATLENWIPPARKQSFWRHSVLMRGALCVTGLGQGAAKAQLGLSELLEELGSVLALAEASSGSLLGQGRSASAFPRVKRTACSEEGPSFVFRCAGMFQAVQEFMVLGIPALLCRYGR